MTERNRNRDEQNTEPQSSDPTRRDAPDVAHDRGRRRFDGDEQQNELDRWDEDRTVADGGDLDMDDGLSDLDRSDR